MLRSPLFFDALKLSSPIWSQVESEYIKVKGLVILPDPVWNIIFYAVLSGPA